MAEPHQDMIDHRYRLASRLGSGGVADVWAAVDAVTGDRVAVKRLHSTLDDDGERMRREARILERLDHPSIARFRAAGVDRGQPYLVLDLVEGVTLTRRLYDDGPLPYEEVRRLAAQLGDALAYAHERGVVHRDVKPSNVMLGADGRAVLVDFGVGRLVGSSSTLTRTGMVTGTIAYTSPEQVSGQPVTEATDIYSLGLVLTEAATGQRVFDGTPTEIMARRLAGDAPIPQEIPVELSAFLVPMTFLQSGLRPSARDVADLARPPLTAEAPTTRIATPTAVFSPVERSAATVPAVGALAGAMARAEEWWRHVVGRFHRTPSSSARIDPETSRVHLLAATGMAALLALGALLATTGGSDTAEASDEPVATATTAAPTTITTTTTTTAAPPPPPADDDEERGKDKGRRGRGGGDD